MVWQEVANPRYNNGGEYEVKFLKGVDEEKRIRLTSYFTKALESPSWQLLFYVIRQPLLVLKYCLPEWYRVISMPRALCAFSTYFNYLVTTRYGDKIKTTNIRVFGSKI